MKSVEWMCQFFKPNILVVSTKKNPCRRQTRVTGERKAKESVVPLTPESASG